MPVSGTVSDAAVKEAVKPTGGTYQAAGREAGYWGHEVTPANTTGPVQQSVDVLAAWPGGGSGGADLVTTETAETTMPAALQVFTYDLDGNMLSDGLWT